MLTRCTGKTYPLEAGLGAEGGRLLHYAVDSALECGVLISEVQVNITSDARFSSKVTDQTIIYYPWLRLH